MKIFYFKRARQFSILKVQKVQKVIVGLVQFEVDSESRISCWMFCIQGKYATKFTDMDFESDEI